jgi:hypothetical protein
MSAATFAVNGVTTAACRSAGRTSTTARRVSALLRPTSPTVALAAPKLRTSKRNSQLMMTRASEVRAVTHSTSGGCQISYMDLTEAVINRRLRSYALPGLPPLPGVSGLVTCTWTVPAVINWNVFLEACKK